MEHNAGRLFRGLKNVIYKKGLKAALLLKLNKR